MNSEVSNTNLSDFLENEDFTKQSRGSVVSSGLYNGSQGSGRLRRLKREGRMNLMQQKEKFILDRSNQKNESGTRAYLHSQNAMRPKFGIMPNGP